MPKNRDLDRGDIFPASWTDAIQEFLGGASANLRLRVTGPAQITAVASTGSDQSAASVNGLWRYRTTSAAVTISPPGSPATWDVFLTASANVFSESPTPDTDNTEYAFGLECMAQGSTPSTYAYRKVAEVEWDGSTITTLRQLTGAGDTSLPVVPTASTPAVVPLKVRGASAQTASLARFETSAGAAVAQINADGSAAFSQAVTVAAGGVKLTTGALEFGGDANAQLSRPGSGRLKSSGTLEATTEIVARHGTAVEVTVGDAGSSKPGVILNDAKVYRDSSGIVKVENYLDAVSGLRVGGVALASTHLSDAALLARLASPTFTGTFTAPSLVTTSSTVGFFGVTPIGRRDYTLTNYSFSAGHRAIDRNNLTVDQLADVVCCIANDLIAFGLFS